jgi:hypothetical protein
VRRRVLPALAVTLSPQQTVEINREKRAGGRLGFMVPVLVLLGAPLTLVRSQFPNILKPDEPENDDPELGTFATAVDDSFELSLDDQGFVQTVFVYRECLLIEGEPFSFRSSRKEIRKSLGAPQSSGNERIVAPLGPKGAWDRYLRSTHFVHFQFQYGGSALQMITYMTLKRAPRTTS